MSSRIRDLNFGIQDSGFDARDFGILGFGIRDSGFDSGFASAGRSTPVVLPRSPVYGIQGSAFGIRDSKPVVLHRSPTSEVWDSGFEIRNSRLGMRAFGIRVSKFEIWDSNQDLLQQSARSLSFFPAHLRSGFSI